MSQITPEVYQQWRALNEAISQCKVVEIHPSAVMLLWVVSTREVQVCYREPVLIENAWLARAIGLATPGVFSDLRQRLVNLGWLRYEDCGANGLYSTAIPAEATMAHGSKAEYDLKVALFQDWCGYDLLGRFNPSTLRRGL